MPVAKLKGLAQDFGEQGFKSLSTAKTYQDDTGNESLNLACTTALDVCQDKMSASNACRESWTSGFGVFCMDDCAAASGACEVSTKVCELADGE